MRKSDASQINVLNDGDRDDLNQRDKNRSQHDQNLGGQHEHHGSQHDESKLQNFGTEAGGEDVVGNSQQWHDIKVIESEAGSQELVIENLENLGEATALVVTRDQSGNFKIGIQ